MNSTCELGDDAARALEPYQDYKDSGVPWLGEVPKHWEVRRLKSWLDVNEFVLSEDTDPEYTFEYLDIGSVATGRLTAKPERIRFGNSPSRARRVVRPGDTIVSTVRTYLKAVWYAEHQGDDLVASTGFAVLTPRRGTFPRFVSYFCQSDPFTNRVTAEAVGIAYPAIAETRLGTFEVCIPPYPEQAAIVRFLDHADQRIRRYIRAKQKLITLLEEQKQAVIHRAVTRGLDPNVRLKPSGVEWLGDVPKHWKTERAKWLFRKMEHPVRDNDEVVTCFRDGVVTLRKNRRVRGFTESLKEIGYQGVRRGDLVIHAMDAFAGAIGVSDSDGKGTPVYSVCSPRQSANAYYYAFCVREMARSEWILALAKGIRERSTDFRFKDFASQWVPLPPLSEQAAIVSFLDRATADLDAATTSAQRETSLIREYHTHLIADVVTGKFDVRAAAARLPDEVEELEPLDEADALIDGEEEPTDALATVP